MTKVLLFVMAFLATTSTFSQTTMKDYLYITAGYKDDISKGKNPSSDYRFPLIAQSITQSADASNTKNEKRTCKLLAVYKLVGEEQKLAAYMIQYQKDSEEIQYICIPSPNSSMEVTQAYLKSLYDGDPKINPTAKLQTICLLLSKGLKW